MYETARTVCSKLAFDLTMQHDFVTCLNYVVIFIGGCHSDVCPVIVGMSVSDGGRSDAYSQRVDKS